MIVRVISSIYMPRVVILSFQVGVICLALGKTNFRNWCTR